jgi:CDP-2,3-bis-(O-geranylgeranyl)-sn-glycerol synthase
MEPGNNWITNILVTLVIFTPAYLANMSPVLLWKTGLWKRLRKPVDLEKSFYGQRLFGEHKTYFGLVTAGLGGMAGALLSLMVIMLYSGLTVDMMTVLLVIFDGFWIGIGAILGDLVKSFFKRRMAIKDGRPLIFFDQIDFIVGAWLMMLVLGLGISWVYFLIAIIITPLLHLGTNYVAFRLGLKKVWW